MSISRRQKREAKKRAERKLAAKRNRDEPRGGGMIGDGLREETRVGHTHINAVPPNEAASLFSKNLSGLPPNELTPAQNLVAAMDDLMALVQNDESAVFEREGHQKGFFHAGKKRADRYWHDPQPCVFPGCPCKSIPASHTLQRGGPLALVAEKQHVLTPIFDRREGRIVVDSVGIGEASTFPGFCEEHEQLFGRFEAKGQLANDEDVALQVFRSICREVVHKRASIWEMEQFLNAYDLVLHERGMKFMEARLGSALFNRLRTRIQFMRIEGGSERKAYTLEAIDANKKSLRTLEQDFLAPSHSEITGGQGGLSHVVIRVSQTVPVCLAGTANFGIMNGDHKKDVRVFVNVWPSPTETVISIASERTNENFLAYYVNAFADQPLGPLAMIETWMVRGTDQWFIKPSVWNGLPTTRQEQILADLSNTRINIGDAYGVSIFDEIRRTMLASPDAEQFTSEALEIESRKITS